MSITKINSKETQFILNILEISGKNIVNTYINDVKRRLEINNLKYKIEMITDDDFYNLSQEQIIYGGGNTTFPYKHFESAFDKITNTFKMNTSQINTNQNTTNNSNISSNPSEEETILENNTDIPSIEVVDRMMMYNPTEIKDVSEKDSIKNSKEILLDIPIGYNGIIHISLIVSISNDNVYSGGITQLNNFLQTYDQLN